MSSGNELAVRSETAVAMIEELEDSFAVAKRQRELLEDYIKDKLQPGKHFYKAGGGGKNSLTKDGAEVVCLSHGYKPKYEQTGGPDDPPYDDVTRYQISARCALYRGDQFMGEGLGSANSHVTKRDGSIVPRQPDVGLRHNATLKMAQKSAFIAATLNSTAASEFFTQDIEDGAQQNGPPSGGGQRPQSDQADPDSPLYCAEHNVMFFKKGRMQSYGHQGKDGWNDAHNKPKDWTPESAPAQDPSGPEEAPHPAEQTGF